MSNPQEFARQYGAQAAAVGEKLGVDPAILLGQWGLETGWGKSVIPGTNNLGNIKDFSGKGTMATDNMTASRDAYRTYETPEAFGEDFAGLIGRKYQGAIGAGNDAAKFAAALKQGGYAEDPNYERKLVASADLVRKAGGLGDRVAAAVLPSANAASGADISAKIKAARDAGYSDEEITQHLSGNQGFAQKLSKAREAGYSDQEIYGHLGLKGASAPSAPSAPGALQVDIAHQDAPPAEPSMLDRVGRQVGLTARAAIKGAASLPEMATNGVISGVNSAFGTNIPQADVGATLSAIGLPEPANSTERVVQDVAGAMSGVGGTYAAGNALAKAASPVVSGVGRVLASAPGVQTASAASGAAAGGITREEGGGAGSQIAATLGASIGPSAALTGAQALKNGLIRGGEAGRNRLLENIETFRRAGTVPTMGQATENRLVQGVESTLARTPGGAGAMNRKALAQTDEIAQSVDGITSRLSPNAGPVEAGESVTRGLEGFKRGVKETQNQLYNRLDDYLPATTPIEVSRTKTALADLNADIEGAPALSAMFKNGRIQGIEGALGSDIRSGTTAYGAQAAKRTNTLPYESIKKLRTLVGKEIDNSNFTSDVPRDKWRALYGALSEDLGDAARKSGPEATEAWRWANQFTKTQTARLDELNTVAGGDTPERVFQAALSGSADGDTVLRRVVGAIPKENRKDLAAAVIRRMGRANNSNQNDVGDAFSTNTFLTNWSKLSPQARETLFGRTGDSRLLDELANLAKVASNIRDGSKVFANPSGTSGATAAVGLGVGGITSAMSGNIPALAGVVATPIIANGAARLLTSRNRLMQLAQPAQMSTGVAGGATNALTQIFNNRR